MKVVLTDKAKDQLASLTRVTQVRIIKKLVHAETAGVDALERMTDLPFFKLRVGDYRAIGTLESDTFTILIINHRSVVYKKL